MSDYQEQCAEMAAAKKEARKAHVVACPVCVAKLPKAHPSILLPQQVCKIHGFRDPRPRLTQGDAP